MTGRSRRRRLRFERRLAVLVAAWALLTLLLDGWLLWAVPFDAVVRTALAVLLLIAQGMLLVALLNSLLAPLRALTNVLEGYRSGDYTLRSRQRFSGDALADLANEINCLGRALYEQRLRATEASALLDKLIGSIEVAILAFDGERHLRLINPAASRLLARAPEQALGRDSVELALDDLLTDQPRTQIITSIAGQKGCWQATHGTFREGGLTQHLLIVADVRQALREEERTAWQRLIRVISHEVNNSLAPIKSLAGTLRGMLSEPDVMRSIPQDALPALQVIEKRTDSLQRFLAQYSRLARLSAPRRAWVRIAPLFTRLAKLEQPHSVLVEVSEGLEAFVDEDQIEQALINLVKNAIEAQGGTGSVTISASDREHDFVVKVTDEGPGIANSDNLFVPFFTTKPGGSGIGLLLCRQIAEGHAGTLRLENRTDAPGVTALLEVPGAARRARGSRSLST